MWLVGSKPIRSNVTVPTTSFSRVFFFLHKWRHIWRRWGLTALLCLNRMPAHRLIASPQTSFEVRSSRIHFFPTDAGEKWMRDERTPKDVCGEANRLMTCVFCVSLSSAPMNKAVIVFASFFLAPAPGVDIVGLVKRNVRSKNSWGVGGGGAVRDRGKSLSLPLRFFRLVLLRCEKLLLFFIGLKTRVNSKYQSKGLTATSYICLLLSAFLVYVFWKLKTGFGKAEKSAGCGIFVKKGAGMRDQDPPLPDPTYSMTAPTWVTDLI